MSARVSHTREKRVLMTPKEEREVDSFLAHLRGALDTNVTFSHILRSLVRTAMNSEKKILIEARRAEIERPRNGDLKATTAFEAKLGRLFHTALKKAAVTK